MLLLEAELMRKLVKAIPMAIIHWRAFKSFSAGLRDQSGVDIASWEQSVIKWEIDPDSVPSPYLLPDNGMIRCERVTVASHAFPYLEISIATIKEKLAKEEHLQAKNNGLNPESLECTASSIIISGLEIEELQ